MTETASNLSATRRHPEWDALIEEIGRLPSDWHLAGSMGQPVLRAIAKHAASFEVINSVETGSGKSTLLFSHMSRHHCVFAVEGDNRSITAVKTSPLFNARVVQYLEGFTQVTMPRHQFTEKLQMALIDGPHGYPFPELEYYYIYPHLATGAVLVVDDIQIPTINRLQEFLREDEMFELLEVVRNTAFFRRTDAPTFDPLGDGWWLQEFNKRRFPMEPRKHPMDRAKAWLRRRFSI